MDKKNSFIFSLGTNMAIYRTSICLEKFTFTNSKKQSQFKKLNCTDPTPLHRTKNDFSLNGILTEKIHKELNARLMRIFSEHFYKLYLQVKQARNNLILLNNYSRENLEKPFTISSCEHLFLSTQKTKLSDTSA